MSATIYRDVNFGGDYQRLGPGVHYGRGLVGERWGGVTGYELTDDISSLRVDRNTVVTLYDSQAGGAGPGPNSSRVVQGPAEIPDLGTIGMDNRVSRVEVNPYLEPSAWGGAPVDYGSGVILSAAYSMQGRQALLPEGDYSAARLQSSEYNFSPGTARSLVVSPGYLAILHTDASLGSGTPAATVPGPARIDDLERLNMFGTLQSVRVLRTAGSGGAPQAFEGPGPYTAPTNYGPVGASAGHSGPLNSITGLPAYRVGRVSIPAGRVRPFRTPATVPATPPATVPAPVLPLDPRTYRPASRTYGPASRTYGPDPPKTNNYLLIVVFFVVMAVVALVTAQLTQRKNGGLTRTEMGALSAVR